jgi:hypothetical protein
MLKKLAIISAPIAGLIAPYAHAQQFFTAPSSTDFLTNASAWSSPLFTALLAIAAIVVGLVVGGLLVSALMGAAIRAVKKVTGGGRSGGGRRRRR